MSDKLMNYDKACEQFDSVLGVEVHMELSTETKMFDYASNAFGGEPNTHITPMPLGLPGSLPVMNHKVVEYAIRIGLVLNCNTTKYYRLARKDYFYPDLAKIYRVSRCDEPTCYDGYLDMELEDGEVLRVEIRRAHMEEDADKNTHIGGDEGHTQGADHSLVDYNRTGVPLAEIVTKPIYGTGKRAPEAAAAYVHTLHDIFRAIDVSEVWMEHGNVCTDANVSIRPGKDAPLGTRTETKNVNSFRGTGKMIHYEMRHQVTILAAGGKIVQETRRYHAEDGTTSSRREKFDAEDYRYFPEPDLVPLQPSREWVEEIRTSLPETPAARRKRLQGEWGFTDIKMRDIVNVGALDLIDQTATAGAEPIGARKWWMGETTRLAKEQEKDLEEMSTTSVQIAELETLVADGKINDRLTKQVIAGALAGEGDPAEVVKVRSLEVVSDTGALESVVKQALTDNPDVVEKIKGGKIAAIGVLVGPAVKTTCGPVDAKTVKELTMKELGL